MEPHLTSLHGWGRAPIVEATELRSEDLAAVTPRAALSRGLGRSYGDSSLPASSAEPVASSLLADRILAFDPASGLLRAEAGFTLEELYRVFLPRGFFSPVAPGTQFVTLGGMVATDVHGKNHHVEGSFGAHVTWLKLRVADGRIVTCTPTENADLFRGTIGGMGLLGHILEVEVRLVRVPSPWIYSESVRVPDLDSFLAALREAAPRWPQTVGWIDCVTPGRHLGRGILIKGRWATAAEAPAAPPRPRRRLPVPFELPSGLLSPPVVRVLNAGYYWLHHQTEKKGIVHPESYFWPLDQASDWYRLYGKRGMTQYQCVLPEEAGPGAARRFLELLVAQGGASPLCVIKDCGPQGAGVLSFPKKGITIAVDIPVTRRTQALIDALNDQVLREGGRIYLAKDAFTRKEHFQAMEGARLDELQRLRRKWDPRGRIRSAQSVRLLGDA